MPVRATAAMLLGDCPPRYSVRWSKIPSICPGIIGILYIKKKSKRG